MYYIHCDLRQPHRTVEDDEACGIKDGESLHLIPLPLGSTALFGVIMETFAVVVSECVIVVFEGITTHA